VPGILAGRRPGGRGTGARLCLRAGRDGNRGGLCAELELAAGEGAVGALVLEEDDLAVGLPAELQADAELLHRSRAGHHAGAVHLPLAVGAADAHAALADGGEHRIAVGGFEVRLYRG
jgi:hypothetical protein